MTLAKDDPDWRLAIGAIYGRAGGGARGSSASLGMAHSSSPDSGTVRSRNGPTLSGIDPDCRGKLVGRGVGSSFPPPAREGAAAVSEGPILSAKRNARTNQQSGKQVDRRLCIRFRPLAAYCQVLAPASLCGGAIVVNLSAHGACLSLRGSVPVGTLLHLRLSNREQLLRHEVVLRVTHVRAGEGASCRAAGPFEKPLPPSVLLALMR
jgi:hypothetical protein